MVSSDDDTPHQAPPKRSKTVAKRKQPEKSQPCRSRASKQTSTPEIKWTHALLSDHDAEIRPMLFMNKDSIPTVIIEKKVKMEEFEDYDVMDPIYKIGWGGIMDLKGDKCYDEAVIEWMSTLEKGGDTPQTTTLTGEVKGKKCTLTLEKIRAIAGVDTGIRGEPDRPYMYPDENYLTASGLTRSSAELLARYEELFFMPPDTIELDRYYLKPQAKVLWRLGVWNIFPRDCDLNKVRIREITILYCLITCRVAISFAHLMMLNLWATYESKDRTKIPHGYIISQFLEQEGAIKPDMVPKEIRLRYRDITKASVPDLYFFGPPNLHIMDKEYRTFIAKFDPEEREIIRREKEERVRGRIDPSIIQEQPPRLVRRSRTIELGGSSSGAHPRTLVSSDPRILEMLEALMLRQQKADEKQQERWDTYMAHREEDLAYRREDRAYHERRYDELQKLFGSPPH